MRILIAGCGDIGTKAGIQLQQSGHEVFGLKRNVSTMPDQIIPIQADLSRVFSPELLPTDIDLVIYILAASGFNEQAYRQAYVLGAKHLINALGESANKLKRFIFVSSTSVYAQNSGEWVDEQSPTEPSSFNGQIMLEAEKQILQLPGGLIVRFSGIYGPGRNRMLEQIKSGQIAAEEPVIYSNRIHSEDCARVLGHLVQTDEIIHKIILASDHCPVSLHEFQTWLADQLNIPEPKRDYQIPKRRAGSKRINNKRLIELGYEFKYPDYQAGYLKILATIE